jgi:hypothetical protein
MTKTHVTFFRHMSARFKSEADMTLEELRNLILNTSATTKIKLPWLKLARFGTTLSPTGSRSLRHNANVVSVNGVEMDYDAKEKTVDFAVATLQEAKIMGLVYTSPTHRVDAPKWRILCPTSTDLAPTMREVMAARINGAFGSIFAGESFTLSQSYYYGCVKKNSQHRAIVVNGDFIDRRQDLDSVAILRRREERRRRQVSRQIDVEVDERLIEMAFNVIPNSDLDWTEWNRLGMALWVATEGSDAGLAMFDAWSKKSEKYGGLTTVEERWNSYFRCPPNEIGVGTIIYEANGIKPWWRNAYDDEVERVHKEAMKNPYSGEDHASSS